MPDQIGYFSAIKDIIKFQQSTIELMPNQVDRDFSGASAWVNVNIETYDATGDLSITADEPGRYCRIEPASAPFTEGKRYRLKCDVANLSGSWTLKDYYGVDLLGTVTINGLQQCFDFIPTTTGGIRISAVGAGASADFDNFSLVEIGLTAAANNTAAAAAGVVLGGLYRTDADPSVVCVRTI